MKVLKFSNDTENLLTAKQVAEILGVSVHTLQSWRVKGSGHGPDFIKLKKSRLVRYRKKDLATWINAKCASSTSSSMLKDL